MSYSSLLIETCTIQRFSEGALDNYGIPAKTWTDISTDESCRLMTSSGREVKVGAEVVVADYKLFLGDVSITEQDRVVIDSTTYEILLVADREDGIGSHHKECFMRAVR